MKKMIMMNGNCKEVVDMDACKIYGSQRELAEALGCTPANVSIALKKGSMCKGHRVCYSTDVDVRALMKSMDARIEAIEQKLATIKAVIDG